MPVIVRAVFTGSVVAAVGSIPWALLVEANLTFYPSVPWAVPLTALYLWIFWRYVQGEGWPRSTAEARRLTLRANRLSADVWGAAIVAGGLGLVAVVFLQVVMNRVVTLPPQQDIDVSRYPVGSVVLWVLTSAAVAGVVEESAFRGYMQGPIERRHGPVIAILVTGSLFGFAHFTHPEVTLILMPFYLAVAAVYGALAYLTNSILPSMVLHAGGNVLAAFNLFARGRSEWQASSTPQPLIWETGADASFWISLVAAVIAGAAAVWAYTALAGVARRGAGQRLTSSSNSPGGMKPSPLSPQTRRRLNALFAPPDRSAAERMLVEECGNNLPFDEHQNEFQLERVRFAALKQSQGALTGLRDAVEVAKIDARDLLMAAGFGHDVRAHEAWFPDTPPA